MNRQKEMERNGGETRITTVSDKQELDEKIIICLCTVTHFLFVKAWLLALDGGGNGRSKMDLV